MLDKNHKAEINRAVVKICNILRTLDDIPVDPRVIDILEIAASLMEQQIDQDVIYEIEPDEDMQSRAMPASKIIEPGEYEAGVNGEEIPKDYDTSGFLFLDSNSDIPSANELDEWFNQPWPDINEENS